MEKSVANLLTWLKRLSLVPLTWLY